MKKDILFPLRCIHGFMYESSYRWKNQRRIKKFKNKHWGERCFIIGNGPSLCVEDLEKIHNEICFSSHRIYHIFDKTQWRPQYYCAQDQELIRASYEEINQCDIPNKFIACINIFEHCEICNAVKVPFLIENFYPELPKFSDDVSLGTYEGYTVTYMCIQLAAYMGFKEIVLLGIDHQYSIQLNQDGTIDHNPSILDHFSEKDTITNIPQTHKSTLAYVAAEKYAKEHGIRILNATRGGALEVFERIDLDALV